MAWIGTTEAARLLGISPQALRKKLPMLEHDRIARRTMDGGRRRWVFDRDRLERGYDGMVQWRSDSPREQIRRARIAASS